MNRSKMRLKIMLLLLLCLSGTGVSFSVTQEILPAGITCCDEKKIRQAMTEEVLARILVKTESGLRNKGLRVDYLSDQAFEKIKRHIPDGADTDQRLAFLREMLQPPAPDRDIEEFQTLVGHFIQGMTLEIGITMQDEYDQALQVKEKTLKLLNQLEKISRLDEENLGRALFQVDLTAKELKRIRACDRRWKNSADASPFKEFNTLKRNITGRAPDRDQWLVFELAEKYRSQFPFLDEFLENYRRVAAEFLVTARNLSDLLSGSNE